MITPFKRIHLIVMDSVGIEKHQMQQPLMMKVHTRLNIH